MWKEKEYLDLLKNNGVDVALLVGSNIPYSHYEVGDEFYFSFAYYASDAKLDKFTISECLIFIETHFTKHRKITDRFKIIKRNNFAEYLEYNEERLDFESCVIQNLRTSEYETLNHHDLNKMVYNIMV